MSVQNIWNAPKIKNHYGLAIEEIKLERSISQLHKLVDSYGPDEKPEFLLDEIAQQNRQLLSLRKVRSL